MATIVQLAQGSAEWHAHRRIHRNASETAAVLGLSPWQTPYQLWLQKTGRAQAEPATAAMLHGTRTEPRARAAYEERTGHVMEPLVLVDGEYSASLDGMTLDGSLIVEIKCPAKGRDSALWRAVREGDIPAHYRWQLQHQLMVSGAALAHLFVSADDDALLLEHAPDPQCWTILREGWDAFMACVRLDQPPPLTERDVVERTDDAWQIAAQDFLQLHALAEDMNRRLDAAKKALIALTRHTAEQGAGVSVTRYWKAGAIDCKRLAQAAGIDVEQFRGAGREETRVSVMK